MKKGGDGDCSYEVAIAYTNGDEALFETALEKIKKTMDLSGLEPLTSSLRTRRSTS